MNRDPDQTVDWIGFAFSMQLIGAVVFFAITTQLVLPYAYAQLFAPAERSTLTLAENPSPGQEALPPQKTLASSTERVINRLTVADAVPAEGKFIAADLVAMKLSLYEDGLLIGEYPIVTKGKPGTPWETPSGFYNIYTKEESHFSSTGKVFMPYSMQFFGNYFIHGWPYYPSGTPVASTFSGGCIRLNTEDAARVFAFATAGTSLFVYDSKSLDPLPPLVLQHSAVPAVSAVEYLVSDIDTGDVYAEKGAQTPVPIASVTKLMTALVANETINFEQRVPVARGVLLHPQDPLDTQIDTFPVGDLLYPLLMESNNVVADSLAQYYGAPHFIKWMNTTAKALDMSSTHFADASGASADNTSTPDDLFRLAVYLVNKKSFIWDITRTPAKIVGADSGETYAFNNFNIFASSTDFIGGKVGHTTLAKDAMMSVFTVPVGMRVRRIAVIVLQSDDYTADTTALTGWFKQVAHSGDDFYNAACATCAQHTPRRQIQL